MDRLIVKGDIPRVAAALIFSLLSVLAFLYFAQGLSRLLDGILFERSPYNGNVKRVYLLAAILIRFIAGPLSAWFSSHFAAELTLRLKLRLLQAWKSLTPRQRRDKGEGDFATTLEEGTDRIYTYFQENFPGQISMLLIPLACLIYAFATDLLSGVILLVTAPLIPVFIILINDRTRAMTQRQWQRLQTLGGTFSDILQGMVLVKLYRLQKVKRQELQRANHEFARQTLNILRIAFLSSFVLELAATLSIAVIAVESGLRLLYGRMAFPEAIFLLMLAPEFYAPLRRSGARFHRAREASAAMDEMEAFLTPGVFRSETSEKTAGYGDVQTVELNSIRPACLSGGGEFSAGVRRGELLLIRGDSGAGKSSLAAVLAGLELPEKGYLSVNGIPVDNEQQPRLRRSVDFIPQFPAVFHGTLRFNLQFHHDRSRDDVLDSYLKRLHLFQDEDERIGGLDGMITDSGRNLSGGERQRLALARALVSGRPIMILDEVGSQVDPDSAAHILNVLKDMKEGRIIIMISHREDFISVADGVLTLSDVDVPDRGEQP